MWRTLPRERRLAAYAAVGLFITMFLPWYQRQFFVFVGGKPEPASDSQTAWSAFSFVEAAVLLVAAGVLTLVFQRAKGKAFHLPGGDGFAITAAGFWTCLLIIWRIFDKQGGQAASQYVTSYGIEWGIFVALAVAASLAYAGARIRAAHQPEPPLPGEDDPPGPGWSVPGGSDPRPPRGRAVVPDDATPVRASRRPRMRPAPAGPERPARAPAAGHDPAASTVQPPSTRDLGSAPPRRASRERRVGWLTARPGERDTQLQDTTAQPPTDWPAPEFAPPSRHAQPAPESSSPSRNAQPAPDSPPPHRPVARATGARPPMPVAADEPPTIRASRKRPPLPPSTPAAQRGQEPEDELTIPLEREDPAGR